MPKYMFNVSYTAKGVQGISKEGGTGRLDASRQAAESVGGTIEAFYFAFGEYDAYVVADLPDNETAAALALAVNSSDAVVSHTVVLMTPEELDAAREKQVEFRPAGA